MQNNSPDNGSGRPGSGPNEALTAELAQRSKDLARSDAIRRAVTLSATELLRSLDLDRSIPKVMELLGSVLDVSRIHVYENEVHPDGRLAATLRYEWDAPGVTPAAEIRSLAHLDAAAEGPTFLLPTLLRDETHGMLTREARGGFRRLLESLGVKSVLVAPIFVDGTWWGQMGLDDCANERAWSPIETDTLKTVAEMIGAAMAGARRVSELATAATVIENSPAVLYRVQAESPYPLVYISPNIARYGYTTADFLTSPTRYIELIHPDDRSVLLLDISRLSEGRDSELNRERRFRIADGSYVWFDDHVRALRDEHNRPSAIEGVLIDINDRKAADAQLARAVATDPLTGLANRKAFMDELATVFAAAKHGGPPFAILYLDLDRFKDINDVLGHSTGDELLKHVARRLRRTRRAEDLIARFGGDEFAILQTDLSDPADAGTLAARVLQVLAEPYDLGTQIHVTASIGISVFTPAISGPEEMIKQADLALYRAKDAGRNQYHFHSEELDIAIVERVTLAGDLRLALERGELELYYQPQVETKSGKIVGLEALARWHHPTQGLLCPTRFIPIAEQTGTILPLGDWVIGDVCRQIVAWRGEGLRPPTVAINVSAAQLKALPDFEREFMQSLGKWNLEPAAIELELTESVLMETTREHADVMSRLRASGVPIAIDDFGTGYSSLGYLRAYRVNHLKIAQEFIKDLQDDPEDIAIVRASISLARELGIKVIAEGVETAVQFNILADAGCECIQGFYFSRPVPSQRAAELLRRGTLQPLSSLTSEGCSP